VSRPVRACVVALVVLASPPTAAFAVTPTPTPRPGATATPSPTIDPRTAAQIAKEVAAREQALAKQRAALAEAGATAATTLQAYQEAQHAADQAERQAAVDATSLSEAVRRTGAAQQGFDGLVGSLYKTGMTDPRVLIVSAALSAQTSTGFFDGIALAERVGTEQSRTVDELATAVAVQDLASQQAKAAQAVQKRAAQAAKAAKEAADKVLAAAAAKVARQNTALVAVQGVLAVARRRESNLAKAEVIARDRARLVAGLPPRGTCKGGDTRGYPNGELPPEALCVLWGTSGQVLQQDAAAAFDLLSRAYAREFGRPICVTDSYRSYAEQVAVKQAKPELAATPGYSKHGWGIATDLCDGVEQFGSATHTWLLDNAAQLGWFHPAWAEPSGSKPEAWHWEYAGTRSAG
jgi:hypothetical protein